MRKRIRKPIDLYGDAAKGQVNVYAGFRDEGRYHSVYIGGAYYDSSAQIHLSRQDVMALARWLPKAAAYLESKRCIAKRKK